jgi:hypothetical protein
MEKKGMFLTNRHISLLLSVFILSSFFVFISGYFFGKKKTVEKFYGKVDQESLADHVYYSVCSNYGNYDRDQDQESTEDASDLSEKDVGDSLSGKKSQGPENQEKDSVKQIDQECVADKMSLDIKSNIKKLSENIENKDEIDASKHTEDVKTEAKEEIQKEQYYAELVGFGSKARANLFCNRLKKHGIEVVLKKRRSRTSRGRNVDWYQAVTEKFDNKSDLVAFVDIIKDKENLKGVKIIEC